MLLPTSLNECFRISIVTHWQDEALSDYGEDTYTYKTVARMIEKLHIMFEEAGIKPGDKIALCGHNQSRWAVAFLASLTYGAVAVPILHEFHPEQVHDIVNHSEAKLLFAGDKEWRRMNFTEMPNLLGVISNKDYDVVASRCEPLTEARNNINKLFCAKYPEEFTPSDIHYHEDQPEELALINYTSGTTSNSKGVMIPYRALWSNMKFALEVFGTHAEEGDKVLSLLPLAHTYGMSFEFIYEFIMDMHVVFLTKMPSPTVLKKAFAEIKPVVMICVPLILEKIVRKGLMPKIQDPKIKLLMKIPGVGDKIRERMCQGLQEFLGGHVYEVIVGGSAINQEVEAILKNIGFNYTVGYGATECSPIIAYEDWHKFKLGSSGKVVKRMEMFINSSDPYSVPGEVLVKGMNVMLGYYKNPEATAATIDQDGWYHTGDLGIIDREGNLYIKGRCKNMLLGSNGQNIYPEEIEDKLNSLPMVAECVVVQRNEKLYGLVYPNQDQINQFNITKEALIRTMEENKNTLNASLPAYEHLAGIILQDTEFQKTPKKSIKRYLYT